MSEKLPTNFNEAIEKSRQYEFKGLCKVISDMSVELRLLAALAEQSGSDKIDAAQVVGITIKYEDKSLDVMREAIRLMKG